jgi:hypothetical protein
MKDVRTIWPDITDDRYGSSYPGYEEIVAQLGTVVMDAAVGSYQGDIHMIVESAGRYGYVSVSYGSCSGCDALQACESVRQLQDLCDGIEGSVKWFDSPDALAEWFSSRDWEVQVGYDYNGELKTFVEAVKTRFVSWCTEHDDCRGIGDDGEPLTGERAEAARSVAKKCFERRRAAGST